MKLKCVGLCAVMMLGCGSGPDGNLFQNTGGTDSSASSSSGGSGGQGPGSSTSDGSGASTSSGSGGCTPTLSCMSVGAECGTIQDDGCGNELNCGNSCQPPFTCGGGGDQYKCGCASLSCTDQGFDCGLADDGCGNQINCGLDPTDPDVCSDEYELCGKGQTEDDGYVPDGTPNVCGGGCNEYWLNGCANGQMIVCASAGNSPPQTGCTPTGSTNQPGWNGELPSRVWCCP